MYDRRNGPPDRRASKRGGRRATDAMRSVDTIRLGWEGLTGADSPRPARRNFAGEELISDHVEPDYPQRPVSPLRK